MSTPRTDKNAGYYCCHGIKKNADLVIDPNGPFVLADFARELERENARIKEAAKRAVKIAREGRYSAVNFCEVVESLGELDRLSSA